MVGSSTAQKKYTGSRAMLASGKDSKHVRSEQFLLVLLSLLYMRVAFNHLKSLVINEKVLILIFSSISKCCFIQENTNELAAQAPLLLQVEAFNEVLIRPQVSVRQARVLKCRVASTDYSNLLGARVTNFWSE